MTPRPSVSVVVASGAGGEFLFRCLDALRPQVDAEGAELIVPDRVGGATAERLRRDYPGLQVVPVRNHPEELHGRLRREGRFRASRGLMGPFLRSVPLLLPVVVVYVYGEWCGCAFGFGRALEEVE